MEYRELGKSGFKVSAVGLGTWQWGSREWGWGHSYGKKDVLTAFETALELGINLVDTAEIYGRGKSEELIGEALRGHREEVVIATKVSPWNLTYGRVLRAADRSLRRLGADVIDLYQVHFPNPIVRIGNTMKAMRKLIQDGKVRCVGVSNFNLGRMKTAQNALAPIELTSNQVRYNLLERRVEETLLPYAAGEGISIIAYSPLAQGLLTGKYSPNSRPSSFVQKTNGRFSSRNLAKLSEVNRAINEIMTARGKTASQVALNWLLKQENVVAIPGVKNPQHVIDDAGAVDWRLSTGEVEKLEKAVSTTRFARVSGTLNIIRSLARH